MAHPRLCTSVPIPKFAIELAAQLCELRVRGTRRVTAESLTAQWRWPLYCAQWTPRQIADGVAHEPGRRLSIPNLITLGRILLVPVVVWAITAGEMDIAFLLFLVAGLSDLIDGFLAKRFGMATELGAYLDPLADKAMIVSIYVALGIAEAIPRWLVILVVSRDIMIVGAVILSWLVDKPVTLKPLTVSKLNTLAQILLALVVLAALAFEFKAGVLISGLTALVAVLTLASIGFYLAEWVRHMNGTKVRP
jgi:cardiolipin synthase (CMP-forming)